MIFYNDTTKTFVIETPNTSYAMRSDKIGILRNLYYGEKLSNAEEIILEQDGSVLQNTVPARVEYLTKEGHLFYEPCVFASFADGTRDLRLRYKSHIIDKTDKTEKLTIVLKDEFYDFEVALNYTVYEGLDLISKNAVITNNCDDKVILNKMKSGSLYTLWNMPLKLLHLAGTTEAEYQKQFVNLGETIGKYTIDNTRGVCSSHNHVPFFALSDENTTETSGRVWYGLLHWSGDIKIDFERCHDNQLVVTAGINDFDTFITLEKGQSFETPLFTVGFTDGGYEQMSRTLYDYQYDFILPQNRIKNDFPIIYNSWYPYLFDVNEENCIGFIDKAKEIGAELFVIDDGWFGRRKNDKDGLGDWWHDPEKFPRGLKPVADKAHSVGMLFGMWIEPEMVNPTSDLYKEHPEWVLAFPNREPAMKRNQYVLNLAREDVLEFCWNALDKMIGDYDLDYVKWDMNSYIAETGTDLGDFRVKYIENLYELWRRMNEKYPHLLLENCAAGSGRADFGMAPFCDRINRSDNADPVDVLRLHEGFSIIFPPRLAGGAGNIAPEKHYKNMRTAPLDFRAILGMTGSMSVGINILTAPQQELDELKNYLKQYKEIRHITQNAYLYRLSSMYNSNVAAWEYLARDGSEAVVFVFGHGLNYRQIIPLLKLRGLEKEARYTVEGESSLPILPKRNPRTVHGDTLMNNGIRAFPNGDYYGQIIRIKKV